MSTSAAIFAFGMLILALIAFLLYSLGLLQKGYRQGFDDGRRGALLEHPDASGSKVHPVPMEYLRHAGEEMEHRRSAG